MKIDRIILEKSQTINKIILQIIKGRQQKD
jgi:hypothetical protein